MVAWFSILLYQAAIITRKGESGICIRMPGQPEFHRLFWLLPPFSNPTPFGKGSKENSSQRSCVYHISSKCHLSCQKKGCEKNSECSPQFVLPFFNEPEQEASWKRNLNKRKICHKLHLQSFPSLLTLSQQEGGVSGSREVNMTWSCLELRLKGSFVKISSGIFSHQDRKIVCVCK